MSWQRWLIFSWMQYADVSLHSDKCMMDIISCSVDLSFLAARAHRISDSKLGDAMTQQWVLGCSALRARNATVQWCVELYTNQQSKGSFNCVVLLKHGPTHWWSLALNFIVTGSMHSSIRPERMIALLRRAKHTNPLTSDPSHSRVYDALSHQAAKYISWVLGSFGLWLGPSVNGLVSGLSFCSWSCWGGFNSLPEFKLQYHFKCLGCCHTSCWNLVLYRN